METIREKLKIIIDAGQKYVAVTSTDFMRPHNGVHDIRHIPSGTDYEQWLQKVKTFNERYLKSHPSFSDINSAIFQHTEYTAMKVMGALQNVYEDEEFWDNQEQKNISVPIYKTKDMTSYDVFISHANKDKVDYVDELKASLEKLKIKIFYDKDSLEWGDNWKQRILDGVRESEFAIIVISENFFDREWTEKELNELLNRQNRNGQKIILPILHNITIEELQAKYPKVADIQALDSAKYSCDEIALKFAEQLIKRLKT